MRDVYYQSVGNPLQTARLPISRPEIELLPPLPALGVRFGQAASCVSLAAVSAVVVMILFRPPGWSWLEPYDLLFAVPVLLVGSASAAYRRRLRPLLHPLCLAAAALLCLNQRLPWTGRVAVVALVLAVFVYAFGRHAGVLLTASPVARDAAEAFRRRSKTQLLWLAGFAAALIAAVLFTQLVLLKLALLTLPCVLLVPSRSEGLRTSRWRLLKEAVLSWFTYDPPSSPGLATCPIGSSGDRIGLTVLATALAAMALIQWQGSPLPWVGALAEARHETVMRGLEAEGATPFERVRFGSLTWVVALAAVVTIPVVLPWGLALSLTAPTLTDAAALRDRAASRSDTESVLDDIRRSADLIERDSVYLGRVVADGSPSLVPRGVFQEHAHGLGDSGAGKTSLFLCPLIEQLVRGGDCSLIVLDLKADTLELLATLQTAAEAARRDRGLRMPLKVFSNQAKPTFAFNPMTQPFWRDFDLFTRTDILCGANGLTYGTDYGMGYYSSANAAILYHTLKTYPETSTFRELADAIGTVITTAKKRDLNPEIRKAGVHVQEVMKRLAACEPLNVTASSGHAEEVVANAIDMTQVFREPQLLYFHLSATLSPTGAPEIARLVNYMLLAAATQTERKHPVFLVIDEFQRMVASNLEFMLQLARSMGVGVILANQSMADLNKGATNLIPAIEANCRLRQWFSVSSGEDQKRLIEASGLAVDYELGRSVATNPNGGQSVSHSLREKVVPRLTLNDVLLTSDHPFRSILRISRGAGYAQYGGLPLVIESEFHISKAEYDRRRKLPWPELPGCFLPGRAPQGGPLPGAAPPSDVSPGPQWSEEVIGSAAAPLSDADKASLAALFDEITPSALAPPRKRGKRS